jgi:hypothetical protein
MSGAVLDRPLEFTEKGIPLSLRPFFQEYILENLEPDRDAFTVIERTLAWGGIRELNWLFRHYGVSRLRSFVQKYGVRLLPRRRRKYWALYFDLVLEQPKYRTWIH